MAGLKEILMSNKTLTVTSTIAINIMTFCKLGEAENARKLLYDSGLLGADMIKIWELLPVECRASIKELQEEKVHMDLS